MGTEDELFKGGKVRARIHTHNSGQWLHVELFDLLLAHQHHSTRSIVQSTGVRGGNGTTLFLEDWPQTPDLVKEHLLELFIFLDDDITLPTLDGDRCNLLVELALLPRLGSSLIRFDTVVVLLFSSDVELFGSVFTTVTHRELVVNVEEAISDEGILSGDVAELRWVTWVKVAGGGESCDEAR